MSDERLAKKVVRGGAWMGGSFGLGKVLSIAQQVVLVRLLAPEHFGVVSIALIAIGTLDVFTQTGIESAVIQRKTLTSRALDVAWTIILSRAVLVFAVLQASASWVGLFFETPDAIPLMRWLAVTVIVDALTNPELFVRQRDLDYKPHAYVAQAFNLSSLIVSVGFALHEASPWAIVWGRVIGSVVRATTSYIVAARIPRMSYDAEVVRSLIAFGRFVFLGNVLLFVTMRGDDALVGKLLGTHALGFYTVAYALANTPTPTISYLVSKVALPTYAKLQDDIGALKKSYLFVLRCTATVALPALSGLFVLAPDAVALIYGQKWMSIVPTLRILCVYGGLRCLMASAGPLFHGTGKPEHLTKTAAVQFVLTALAIYYPTRLYGIEGTAGAITGALCGSALVSVSYVSRVLEISAWQVLGQLVPSFTSAVIMSVCIYALEHVMSFQMAWIAVPIVAGGVVYGLVLSRLDRQVFTQFAGLIRAARSES